MSLATLDEQYEWPDFTPEERERLDRNFRKLGGWDTPENFGTTGGWPREPIEDVREWRRHHASYLRSLERAAR